MTIYRLLVIASWGVFLAVWLLTGFFAKRTLRGTYYTLTGTLWRVLAVLFIVAMLRIAGKDLSAFQIAPGGAGLVPFIGAVLTMLGVALAIVARLYLGRNWGMPMSVKESPELVTTGPYRLVRHPIYTGVLLAILGSALVAGPWWLLIFVVAFAYFVYSARREEQVMLVTFPDQYPEYQKHTRRIVPFVY